MLHRKKVQRDAPLPHGHRGTRVPVERFDVRQRAARAWQVAGEPGFGPTWYVVARRTARLPRDGAHRRAIEMVVMIVRKQHRIDVRQLRRRQPRRLMTARAQIPKR